MAVESHRLLSPEQLAEYEEVGFLHSLPVLSEGEVRTYRDALERTCEALGGNLARLDGLHLFFRWAWELSTHPRLLDYMEQLIGPQIILKSTRIFYKHAGSPAYVAWHQDGVTERLTASQAPAIWLGLTEATVANGCLRVIPRSHRSGIFGHQSRARTGTDATSGSRRVEHELSVEHTQVPPGLEPPLDLEMRAGEMSFHHPLLLHASNPNHSDGPRIGLSATYSPPRFHRATPVAWVRGELNSWLPFGLVQPPRDIDFAQAVAAYRGSGHQVLYAS